MENVIRDQCNMFHMVLWNLLTLLCTFTSVQTVSAIKSTWKSLDTCKRTAFPQDSKTPGDNGYRIKISGIPEPEMYHPNKIYTGMHFLLLHLSFCIIYKHLKLTTHPLFANSYKNCVLIFLAVPVVI